MSTKPESTESNLHLGRGASERGVVSCARSVTHHSGALLRVLVAFFRSSRRASQSASSDRWIRAKTSRALDFDTIQVGDALPELRKTVSVEQIRAYAGASGDRNPIHVDEQFARAAGLPGVIAHGMLTMAFLNQMVTDWLGQRASLRRLQGRFAGMVVPGDELRCSGTVSGKDETRRRVVVTLSAVNQRGERVFTKGIAEAEV